MIFETLHRANQIARDTFADLAGDTPESTCTQAIVLQYLARHPGASQVEITEATGVDRSTLTEVVLRLMKKHLVERRRKPKDRRVWICKLTEKGERVAITTAQIITEVDLRLAERIPSPQAPLDPG